MNKPGYKKTALGWIPEEWETPFLDDITKRGSGHTPDKKHPEYWNGGIKWVSLKDSAKLDNVFIYETESLISELGIQKSSATIHPKGTVILSRDAGVGKSAILSEPMAVSQHFIAWQCSKKIHNHFLYLWLQFNKSEFERVAIGSTIKTIGLPYFRKLRIVLPPLPEQIKIAQILSTWDKAITQTQQLIEAKQRLKQGLMQQLLTGRMRFKEYIQSPDIKSTRFYSYPSDWAHSKIQEFAKEVSERNEDGDALTVLSCSKYSGFVNSLEYFGKQVFSDDTSNYKVIYRHQFGFPANHIEEGSIGLLKHVDKGMVSPIYIIFDVDKTRVNPDYLYLILKSETYKHIFRSRTSASVDRRGSLRWDEFSDIRVPMPSLSEQARIVGLFESCAEVIAGFESKKEVLIKQKQGLMQKLLTGQIRVKVEA